MRSVIRPWLRLRRAHWRGDPGRKDRRRKLIAELAPGRSFLDIGGMWSVAGDIGFWAEEAGATATTLLDSTDPSEEFLRKHSERNSQLRYVQGDLHDEKTAELVGVHDVVWCTGVLYHTPHPYLQIEHLRALTRERLVLGTHVIPEIPGFPQASIFYPLLDEPARTGFASTYPPDEVRLAVSQPFSFEPGLSYSNWWWGITPSALRAMLTLAGFEILQEHCPEPLFMDIVARPTDAPPATQPIDYARRRGLGELEDGVVRSMPPQA